MRSKNEKKWEYMLHNLPGVGDRTIEKLLKTFGSAQRVCKLSEKDLKLIVTKEKQLEEIMEFKKHWEPEREYDRLLQKQIAFYTAEDMEYPEKLRKLMHPPYGIYCRGKLPPEKKPAVAIIGARECSEYGVYMAECFGRAMAQAGVQVISGMARGVDGISQQAALSAGGRTWAVLGCGVDICYPASNRSLYDKILETGGGILAVVPPGTEPIKRLFPERNRIVAGLCDILLVIEARQKSGTWITVDMALEQGKNVYAIPGRLTDRLSDGCNMLIRQGAGIALSPEDLLAEMKIIWNRNQIEQRKEAKKVIRVPEKDLQSEKENGKEKITHDILQFLDFNPKSVDQIWEEVKRLHHKKELTEIFEELIEACLAGKARQISGNYFVKTGEGMDWF